MAISSLSSEQTGIIAQSLCILRAEGLIHPFKILSSLEQCLSEGSARGIARDDAQSCLNIRLVIVLEPYRLSGNVFMGVQQAL